MQHYDIIIAGAGPAGCTAVLALRNSGLRVAVVDKAVFPRDKVCGDSIGSVSGRILRQIDPALETELKHFAGQAIIRKAKMYSPDFTSLSVQFVREGYCMRRMDFDNWLYTKAQSNTDAEFISGVTVSDVSAGTDVVSVTLADGRILTCSIILGCDGAQSVVGKKLADFKIDRAHYSGAVRRYYRNVAGTEANTLEVYFLENHLPGYFWIFPLAGNEVNVGFGMLSETIARHKINLKNSLEDIITAIPHVRDRFINAEALGEAKGFGLPLGAKRNPISGTRFMLCGDAASLVDPFSGEGITSAMETGKFAAEQALFCFREQDFSAAVLRKYEDRVYAKLLGGFKNHRRMQRLLGKRVWLINLLVRTGNIPFVKRSITKVFY